MSSSPPLSAVAICNIALDYIGESPVNDIGTPANSKEEIMARHYDHTRLTLLRDYVWNFAQAYRELPRQGDGVGGHADAYDLPADWVRLNSVGSDRLNPITDFDILERQIHTGNGTSLPIWYNKDVIDISKMDESFINVLAIRLALKVAYKLTKKNSVVEQLAALYEAELLKAVSVDGQERVPRIIQKSRLLTARRSFGTLRYDNRYYAYYGG